MIFLIELVSVYEATKLRIGVVEENQKATNFWIRMGYKETDRVNIKVGNRDRKVIVMEYYIK